MNLTRHSRERGNPEFSANTATPGFPLSRERRLNSYLIYLKAGSITDLS